MKPRPKRSRSRRAAENVRPARATGSSFSGANRIFHAVNTPRPASTGDTESTSTSRVAALPRLAKAAWPVSALVSAWLAAPFVASGADCSASGAPHETAHSLRSGSGARPAAALPGRRFSRGSAGADLPDSIVARVGNRTISVSDLRTAWRETHPPAGPERLTPESARRFLEVLIDHELIQAAAVRESWTWTPEDSARIVARTDRLVLRMALDEVLGETRAAGDSAADEQALGVAARERVLADLHPRYDAALVERTARGFAALPRPTSDSSLAAQLRMLSASPRFDPADSSRALARTESDGEIRVCDLVREWARLSPAVRPRIESADQVRDLIGNSLFERWLRRRAQERDLAHAPAILRALDHERELIAVQHLMARAIHGTIDVDTAAVERWFVAHPETWTLPARFRITRLVVSDLGAATRIALELRDAAAAESLVARALRAGVRYRSEIDGQRDSALFARASAAGPGAVTGPDAEGDGWSVMRVEALLPTRARTWAESRDEAIDRWYEEQSAARLRSLLDRERRSTAVQIRESAFGPGALGGLTDP